MKKAIFFLILLSFGLNGFSQNPLLGVGHSIFTESGSLEDKWGYGVPTAYPAGHRTFRVYAFLDDANSVLQGVYSIPGGDLQNYIGTDLPDGYLWNYPDFGVMIAGNIPEPYIPWMGDGGTIMYDSYVTIGSENSAIPAGQSEIIFGIGLSNVGPSTYWGNTSYSDIDNPDYEIIYDPWLITNILAPNAYGIGPDLSVLLAQITTTADDIHYGLNVVAGTDAPLAGGESWITYYDPSAILGTSDTEADGSGMGLVYPTCTEQGCLNELACNYDSTAECNGTCYFAGCMDSSYCNFDPLAGCDDSSCSNSTGCNNLEACNYDSTASCFDDSCFFPGCLDSAACNFDSSAGCDDGSCLYGTLGCTLEGSCNYDISAVCNDGSCQPAGCTDPDYCEYNSFVECDDGSCITLKGCTHPLACNYDSTAECNSGTCTWPGCTDAMACNYNSFAGCDDESCIASNPSGCTEPNAINYDLEAICDDGSCDYEGCTNPDALNFSANATITDDSCYFGIGGVVFLDVNEDGIKTIDEPGMENWLVEIPELGLNVYSSDGGLFEFVGLAAAEYDFILEANENWENITPAMVSQEVNDGVSSYILFALSPSNMDYSFFNAYPCSTFAQNIHCEDGFWPGAVFHNNGTTSLNGLISLEWDPILIAEPQWNAVVPDSLGEGYCHWNIIDYPPGQNDIYRIHILGPGAELLGFSYGFTINFDFIDFNDEELFESSIYIEPLVTCAYDPNDKYADPIGYTEEKFVLEDDVIQYKVRFQNTGNWFAEDVVIKDTLSEHLDYSSFEPVFASHNVQTSFNFVNGAIEFNFADIYLPDSTNNEPESHGYVVYNVRPIEGIEPGTIIENTAHIYFDANAAIITNTEFHTIYECTEISIFNPMSADVCEGESIVFANSQEFIEEYYWEFNGILLGQEASQEITFEEVGNNEIGLSVSNPLCESTSLLIIEVYPFPEASFTESGALLMAMNAFAYQWYLNGELIEGATQQTYTAEENGNYSVEVWNENDCSAISEEISVTIISVEEIQLSDFNLYPNPISNSSILEFKNEGNYTVQIYDLTGKLIRDYGIINSSSLEIQKGNLATGNYQIWIQEGNQVWKISAQIR